MKTKELAQAAKKASRRLALLTAAEKNRALIEMAEALERRVGRDPGGERRGRRRGAQEGALAGPHRPAAARRGAPARHRPQPAGHRRPARPGRRDRRGWRTPEGLEIQKVRVPFGVIAVVYEARPNVTVDAAALCLKTGNAVILRGGSDAYRSNRILAEVITGAAMEAGLPGESIQFVADKDRGVARRSAANEGPGRPGDPPGRRGAQGLPARALQGAGHLRGGRQLPRVRRRDGRSQAGAGHHRQRQVPAAGSVQRRRDAAGASRRLPRSSCPR